MLNSWQEHNAENVAEVREQIEPAQKQIEPPPTMDVVNKSPGLANLPAEIFNCGGLKLVTS